jgi:hypothetical protein
MSDLEELEHENRLLRARNERLEAELAGPLSPDRVSQYLDHAMQDKIDKYYTSGWNNALEMAATKLVHDFRLSFGADTCASWAAWLKEQKR